MKTVITTDANHHNSTKLIQDQTFSNLILEHNFGTQIADSIFQSFIDIDQKHDSNIVCNSIHQLVATTTMDRIGIIYDFSDHHDPDFETMMSMLRSSILHYRSEISRQLIEYYMLHRENQPANERAVSTEPHIIFINPIISHEINDSVFNLIFNWNLQPKKPTESLDQKELIKEIEDDYYFMYQLYFEEEDCNERATLVDLISGYARYTLYNHSKQHSINIKDTNLIASAFSNIFKKNLEEEFSKQEMEEE